MLLESWFAGWLVLGSASFLGSGSPTLSMIELDGYLDRAPDGAKIVDTVRLVRGSRARDLVVVRWARVAGGSPGTAIDAPLERGGGRLEIAGTAERVERILGAAEGARVEGSFVRVRLADRLIVNSLESPAPSGAADGEEAGS